MWLGYLIPIILCLISLLLFIASNILAMKIFGALLLIILAFNAAILLRYVKFKEITISFSKTSSKYLLICTVVILNLYLIFIPYFYSEAWRNDDWAMVYMPAAYGVVFFAQSIFLFLSKLEAKGEYIYHPALFLPPFYAGITVAWMLENGRGSHEGNAWILLSLLLCIFASIGFVANWMRKFNLRKKLSVISFEYALALALLFVFGKYKVIGKYSHKSSESILGLEIFEDIPAWAWYPVFVYPFLLLLALAVMTWTKKYSELWMSEEYRDKEKKLAESKRQENDLRKEEAAKQEKERENQRNENRRIASIRQNAEILLKGSYEEFPDRSKAVLTYGMTTEEWEEAISYLTARRSIEEIFENPLFPMAEYIILQLDITKPVSLQGIYNTYKLGVDSAIVTMGVLDWIKSGYKMNNNDAEYAKKYFVEVLHKFRENYRLDWSGTQYEVFSEMQKGRFPPVKTKLGIEYLLKQLEEARKTLKASEKDKTRLAEYERIIIKGRKAAEARKGRGSEEITFWDLYTQSGKNLENAIIAFARLQELTTEHLPIVVPQIALIEKLPQVLTQGEGGKKCMICWSGISKGDEIIQCQQCNEVGHKNHVLEWIRIKGTCAHCQKPMRE